MLTDYQQTTLHPDLVKAASMLGITGLKRIGDYGYTGMYGNTRVAIHSARYGHEVYIYATTEDAYMPLPIMDAVVAILRNDMHVTTLRLPLTDNRL